METQNNYWFTAKGPDIVITIEVREDTLPIIEIIMAHIKESWKVQKRKNDIDQGIESKSEQELDQYLAKRGIETKEKQRQGGDER